MDCHLIVKPSERKANPRRAHHEQATAMAKRARLPPTLDRFCSQTPSSHFYSLSIDISAAPAPNNWTKTIMQTASFNVALPPNIRDLTSHYSNSLISARSSSSTAPPCNRYFERVSTSCWLRCPSRTALLPGLVPFHSFCVR